MTSTAANDEDRSEAAYPPRHAEVLGELLALRRQEGVTPARMDVMGRRLMQLPISRDELQRSGMYDDEIALATIQALRCEVESYNRPEFRIDDHPDPRWVVLRHELNLDQSFGFYLGDRQHVAQKESRLSEKTYARRADAIFSNFAHTIILRRESPCRSPGERLLREAEKIADLPRNELVVIVRDFLLQLGPTAYRDHDGTRAVLARTMPGLAGLLTDALVGSRSNSTLGDAVFSALKEFGKKHYDDVARAYVTSMQSNDEEVLVLPWRALSYLILTTSWPTDGEAGLAAEELDLYLEFQTFPLPIDLHYVEQAMYGGFFYDPTTDEPTEAFHQAFGVSVALFAEMLCEIDGFGRWEMLPKNRPFDRVISRFIWTQTGSVETLADKVISSIFAQHRRDDS